MDFRHLVLILVFIWGFAVGDVYNKRMNDMHTLNCGIKPGYTTLVTEEDGEIICIYRQNSYPFKTQSGRNV